MPRKISEERTRKEMIDPQLEKAGIMLHVDDLRGQMGKSTRQALGRLPVRACRDLEGLFESLLGESFGE